MIVQTLTVGPLECNCGIVADERSHEAVVIDPGSDFDIIRKRLEQSGLKTKVILHTHAHLDHVGATAALQRWSHAPARVHPSDVFMIDMLNVQAAMIGLPPPEVAEFQDDLIDGAIVDVGELRIEVLHTPGHSPGSVCLLVRSESGSVLLSGDTLFHAGIGRTDLWGGDSAAIVQSIQSRLYTLDESLRVIPGHGEETTIGEELHHNPFVRLRHT